MRDERTPKDVSGEASYVGVTRSFSKLFLGELCSRLVIKYPSLLTFEAILQ